MPNCTQINTISTLNWVIDNLLFQCTLGMSRYGWGRQIRKLFWWFSFFLYIAHSKFFILFLFFSDFLFIVFTFMIILCIFLFIIFLQTLFFTFCMFWSNSKFVCTSAVSWLEITVTLFLDHALYLAPILKLLK